MWLWTTFQIQPTEWWNSFIRWSKRCPTSLWSSTATSWWGVSPIYTPRAFATEISSLRTFFAIWTRMSLSSAISVLPSNSSQGSQMSPTSVLDIIGRQNLYLEIQTTQPQSMSGPLDVLLQSSCSDSQFSPERAEWINLWRSSRSWVRHRRTRSKQWTPIIKNTASPKSDRCHGRKCSSTAPQRRRSTLCPNCSHTTQRRDQHPWAACLTHTSKSWEILTRDFQMASHCHHSLTSLRRKWILSHKSFPTWSPSGIMVHREAKNEQNDYFSN